MPHIDLQDVRETVDALSRDEGIILEEKLILLGMANDHVTAVTKKLKGEVASKESSVVSGRSSG